MISLMYSLRMFNDSGSILVYAIKGPKLTECQHFMLGQYGERREGSQSGRSEEKGEGEEEEEGTYQTTSTNAPPRKSHSWADLDYPSSARHIEPSRIDTTDCCLGLYQSKV